MFYDIFPQECAKIKLGEQVTYRYIIRLFLIFCFGLYFFSFSDISAAVIDLLLCLLRIEMIISEKASLPGKTIFTKF